MLSCKELADLTLLAAIASLPKADGLSDVSFIISQRGAYTPLVVGGSGLTHMLSPDGFTKRLGALACAGGGSVQISAFIDGPYGYVRSLSSYESVVLLAGTSPSPFLSPIPCLA